MSWNYRVLKRTIGSDKLGYETEYGIVACHYDPTGWTDPVPVVADSVDELRDVLARMTVALDEDVIDGDIASVPDGAAS